MQSTWVIKNNSQKLILFFNGWSLDENIVNHLSSENYDVLMFNDYANLEITQETLDKINSYNEVNVIAWSFGVWACGNIINNFKTLKNVIAINGTLVPIDNNLGIPEKIFKLTLLHLSEENYVRFFKNMFVGEADLNKLSKRNIDNQKQELQQIQKLSALCPRPLGERDEFQNEERVSEIRVRGTKENKNLFTKAIISSNDKIISAKNQLNFWGNNNDAQSKPSMFNDGGLVNPPYDTDHCQTLIAPPKNTQIIKIEGGHYIFDLFKTWDEIIND